MDVGKLAREIVQELELSGQINRNMSGWIVLRFKDEYELERFLEPVIEHVIAAREKGRQCDSTPEL